MYLELLFENRSKTRYHLTTHDYNKCVDLWSDDVYRFAYHCHGDVRDCEDAVQEAYAALWKNRDDVRFEKAKSYLLSVAYRQIMKMIRNKMTATRNQQQITSSDTAYSPADNSDLKEVLTLAMGNLPEIQKAILQLRDIDGYSYKDIAEILKISDKQVQVYLYRARLNMRKQLNDNKF